MLAQSVLRDGELAFSLKTGVKEPTSLSNRNFLFHFRKHKFHKGRFYGNLVSSTLRYGFKLWCIEIVTGAGHLVTRDMHVS